MISRVADAEAAAAEAEHRVELGQILDARPQLFRRHADLGCNLVDLAILFGEKLVQRRIEQALLLVTGNPAMILKISSKSERCMGRIVSSACRRPFSSSDDALALSA